MDRLKEKFFEKAQKVAEEVGYIRKHYGDKVVAEVTIEQILSGMKGIPALLTLTSKLDPNFGIRFRGYSIPELQERLPRFNPEGEPLPEGLFYLMLTGELPTQSDVEDLSKDWHMRVYVPYHVYRTIDALPRSSKPMTMFATAILAWATESKFKKAYEGGMNKTEYWDYMYEDVMNLIAGLPRVAAYIYRKHFYKDLFISPDPKLDWAGNFAHMMGYDKEEVKRLFRLYMVLHADHEGGNVSAHTTHLVGSALSNCYYSYAAGMLGLAGPLHGVANQEVITWIVKMLKDIGTDTPTNEQVANFVEKTLASGQVIPGYGHAVLRITDPRYTAQKQFAEKYIKEDVFVSVVNQLYEVVPPILGSIGKIKNPWPNVDAYSGALLMHYGIREHTFYPVLFGVSRALGVLASLIWDRVLGLPIERPSSYTLDWFKQKAEGAQ